MEKLPLHFQKLEKYHILNINTAFGIDKPMKRYKYIFKSNQNGGFVDNQLHEFIDEGGLYTYNVRITDEEHLGTYIIVLNKNEEACVSIMIDDDLAIINGLTYMDNCAKEGLQYPGGGNKLLRFSLNLILRNQDRFGTKRILLNDHSFRKCQGSENIKLAQLRLITHGEPWYSSFGFKPFNRDTQDVSLPLLNAIDESNARLDKLKTHDLDILKIVDITNKKEKHKNYNKNQILDIAKKHPLLRDFVKRLTNDFDTYCYFLIHLLNELYRPGSTYGIVDYNMKPFYLDI